MRAKHLLTLLASVLLAIPVLAQATSDCPTAPPKVPNGPITKAIANCAIDHASYLYEHRCTHAANCAAQNAPVTAYYKVASRIYDLYLATKSMDEGSQSHARTHEHALDTFWSARLQEGAGSYDFALRNYTECQKTVPSKSDNFYTLCSQGVTRLTCLLNPPPTSAIKASPAMSRRSTSSPPPPSAEVLPPVLKSPPTNLVLKIPTPTGPRPRPRHVPNTLPPPSHSPPKKNSTKSAVPLRPPKSRLSSAPSTSKKSPSSPAPIDHPRRTDANAASPRFPHSPK